MPPARPMGAPAEVLNRGCACTALDRAALQEALAAGAPGWAPADFGLSASTLFAETPVFLGRPDLERMQDFAAEVSALIASPAWDGVPATRGESSGVRDPGLFVSFDFHLGADGPQLIEINTNAGGAAMNVALARAQRHCCPEVADMLAAAGDPDALAARIVAMFRRDFALHDADAKLERVLIVDDAPQAQPLWPEFLQIAGVLERSGIDARIADVADLRWDGHTLQAAGFVPQLVYNRCTDFALADPAHVALRSAWATGSLRISPHPAAHARWADKRNLVWLSDAAALETVGVDATTARRIAAMVPETHVVDPAHAEAFWAERKRWFFKPVAGFGSRAVYRGDKLTRGRFERDVAAGGYVAQALVPPSLRRFDAADGPREFKIDVRLYVDEGEAWLAAVRLWQGQATNFRTPGGGFAPLYVLPA